MTLTKPMIEIIAERILTNRDRKRAVIRKIRHQFPASAEANLMFAVVKSAITDLGGKYNASARYYLRGPILHAQACSVGPEWIRKQLRTAQVPF